jgi:hypothetical protein
VFVTATDSFLKSDIWVYKEEVYLNGVKKVGSKECMKGIEEERGVQIQKETGDWR